MAQTQLFWVFLENDYNSMTNSRHLNTDIGLSYLPRRPIETSQLTKFTENAQVRAKKFPQCNLPPISQKSLKFPKFFQIPKILLPGRTFFHRVFHSPFTPSPTGPLVFCLRITQTIQLIDFQTLDYVELQREQYWRDPFAPLSDKLPLKEYMVMEVEPRTPPKTAGVKSRKHELSQLWIVPTDKLGSADQSNWLFVSTHLGKLFNTGDLCMGFDVVNSNVSEINWDAYRYKTHQDKLPDVMRKFEVEGKIGEC